ncbi:MAG TPA: phosphoribosyltransferase family protein [Actinomycetota bacterium]|nr:phosphoribosyltransferase family protein [Actinomycetota bacterium]
MDVFRDRQEAGRLLAKALEVLEGEDVVVLGIARGGVPVGAEIARTRGWPLDVVIPRKVGAPGNPELGIGAIAPGVRVLDHLMIERLGVTDEYIEREVAEQEAEIERRADAYRRGRPPADLDGRIAVVVDDGVATGGTAAAALRWARARGAEAVVLAVPVAPPDAVRRLSTEADRVLCLRTPEPFYAVGQWYQDFGQTTDDEVVALLEELAA